jgi:hypothetical protein
MKTRISHPSGQPSALARLAFAAKLGYQVRRPGAPGHQHP